MVAVVVERRQEVEGADGSLVVEERAYRKEVVEGPDCIAGGSHSAQEELAGRHIQQTDHSQSSQSSHHNVDFDQEPAVAKEQRCFLERHRSRHSCRSAFAPMVLPMHRRRAHRSRPVGPVAKVQHQQKAEIGPMGETLHRRKSRHLGPSCWELLRFGQLLHLMGYRRVLA